MHISARPRWSDQTSLFLLLLIVNCKTADIIILIIRTEEYVPCVYVSAVRGTDKIGLDRYELGSKFDDAIHLIY